MAQYTSVTAVKQPQVYTTSANAEIWMRRFSNYINMAEVPEGKIYGTLLAFLDDASLSRFSEIEVTDTEQEDVEALTAKFIACFTPTSLSAQLRYAFHQRKQQKNESLDAFAQALREAAKKAYQQTDPLVLGQLVRDQFINGVNDTYVVEQLQITSPETVDDALRMANIIQLAKQSVTMYQQSRCRRCTRCCHGECRCKADKDAEDGRRTRH